MKFIKKIIYLGAVGLTGLSANAQQLPMFTHYMNNTLSINPAYAGSRNAFTITGLHRSQWVGFKGAPTTQTLTMHTPLKNEHIGLGLTVSNDRLGIMNTSSINGAFSYTIKLTTKAKLAFGLSAGVNMFQADFKSLELDKQNDPVFANNLDNKINPDVGFGLYYSRARMYAGVSIPNLIQSNITESTLANGNTLVGKEQRHFFFIAGTYIPISENLAFKPTTLVKISNGVPSQADFTATFVMLKRFHLGAMVRTDDAVGGLAGFDITELLHIGYSYDWSLGLSTSKYNQGSHEIILRYDFLTKGKKQINTPRYF
jgi:type IX secretion system PorP/SprF family membrane protein